MLLLQKVKSEKTDKILYSNNSSYHEITESFSFLQNQSRKPLSLHWIAPPTLESMVLKEFAILWYWYRRMLKHLQIKWSISFDIKEWMMKWIYSRNKLVIRKVRTKIERVSHCIITHLFLLLNTYIMMWNILKIKELCLKRFTKIPI